MGLVLPNHLHIMCEKDNEEHVPLEIKINGRNDVTRSTLVHPVHA